MKEVFIAVTVGLCFMTSINIVIALVMTKKGDGHFSFYEMILIPGMCYTLLAYLLMTYSSSC